jgi:O-antigen ligase
MCLAEQTQHSRKIARVIETGLKYATYLFLFYVLTGMKKGGDMRLFIPYITALFLLAHLAVSRDFSVLRTAPFYALACYVVISYCLVWYSFAPGVSLAALSRDVLAGMVLFVALHFQSDAEEKLKGLLLVFVLALAVLVFGGYVTYARRYLKEEYVDHLSPDIPFLKFKLYFNVFAMKVNFLLPFAVAGAAVLRTKAARYVLWGLIAASAGAVVLSLSRGGWLSLLVMVCLFSLFLSKGRVKLSHAVTALCGTLLLISAVVWTTVPGVRQRILVNAEELMTFHGRTEIWQHYISAVKESPVTGWGYGDRIIWDNGPAVLTKELEYEVPEQFRIGTHNTMLFVLYHQGIIGLTGYLAFVVAGFVALVKALKVRLDSNAVHLFSLFTALISALFIHSAIESVSFAVPCIIFGFLSGVQQWDSRGSKATCLP